MKRICTLILFLFSTVYLYGVEIKCPHEEYECTRKCGLFIDENRDGYCDYSMLSDDTHTLSKQSNQSQPPKFFYLYTVLVSVLGLYLLSFILLKYKIIEKILHRKIWNSLLIISFLVTGITGLMIAFFIYYSYVPFYYIQLLFLHYNFGLAMTLISIFHAFWHWNYYKTIFKNKKKTL
ncbi:MAG: hypothetical protein GX330_04020 [Bacteroidales bacterium]|nr:hypothetical protein [Bacteroidales bacterium]